MYLFLVGPPGIGKSTVAPILARRLGAAVVDMDRAIERRTHKTNKDTIEQDGMERFRDLESRVLASLRPTPAWIVVDTGGGAPIREENRARMRELGLIIGLRGSLRRVTAGIAATMAKRPDQDVTPADRARAVLRERKAAYADVDVTFDVDRDASAEDSAYAIAAWIVAARGIRVDVGGERPYPVLVRAGLLDQVGTHLADLGWSGRVALVSEADAASLYEARLLRALERAGFEPVALRLPTGEAAKSVRSLARLWGDLAHAGLGRDGGIVALGGGAVGDAAGFAAATYLRGVRVAHVPTTLLGMVDAAIGGKTAIDIPEGKNLVGAFHAPDAVFADAGVLATLPPRQVSSGLAEVVKSAFLADRDAVTHVERSLDAVLRGEIGPQVTTVALAAEVKAGIVTMDPRESGLRELLNFGHTMGHAYEAASRYRVTHGEAVAIGLVYACALSETLDLAPRALRIDVERLLARARLPIRAHLGRDVWSYLGRDKKVRAGRVRWILPRRVGLFSEVTDVDDRALRAAARLV
ncbi:MAG TPA: 3-dehydroquinate synthase, partial [Candidatus Limnocylindria bacterium]|nr:3-dehydroquinate synthase [Candidatus Limnocylindria bacterium]